MKNYKHLSFITGIFTATLLISNTLDAKVFAIGPLTLPSGVILFPLAYIFGDVLTEVYGYSASRKVIWTGFISLLLMIVMYEVARMLPAAPFWPHQESFDTTLKHVPRIVIASISAYFAGEFCNSYVLAKSKVKMNGKSMAFRFIASTVAGQAVDTTAFVVIAFGGVFGAAEMASLILSGWAFKVAWEIVALPLTVVVVNYLKKSESEDYYDTSTNFNPFHLGQKNKGSNQNIMAS